MNLVIVVPAFNESKVIYDVLMKMPKRLKGIKKIQTVAINDGSTDDTFQRSIKAKVYVLSHLLNRGAGAATKTGFEWAKRRGTQIVVTFDADGQHNHKDIEKVIRPIIQNKADIVIGSRFKKKQNVPIDRLLINKLANLVTLLLFGVISSDSQSGLRAFSKNALKVIDFKADRMDFSSEILLEAKRNSLRIKEVPIRAIYNNYARAKGQSNLNAINVTSKFLVRLFR